MTISPCEQPNYTQLLYLIQEEDADMPLAKDDMTALWNKFSHINTEKADLIQLFNSHFQFREISSETLVRWRKLVGKRFLEIGRDYDHAFKVIQDNIAKMDDLGRTITKETEWGSKIKDTFQDTPVTPLSANSYATSVNDRDRSGKDKETTNDNREMYIKEMNELISEFNDLKMKWVNEFESLFMSTIMRV